jgi:hypothetical protein
MRAWLGALFALPLAAAGTHPSIAKYCVGCHSQKVRTANVALDGDLDSALLEDTLAKVSLGQMPPPGASKPSDADRAALVRWIESELNAKSTAIERDPGRVTVRRLNRAEYNNTVRDLLGVTLRPADDFPADDSGYGFDNIGDVLTVPPVLMERYMRAARELAEAAVPLGGPRKPSLEKYVADVEEQSRRVDEDDPKGYPYLPGAFEVKHTFPVDAQYELVVRVKDRRNGLRNEVPVLMFLDGTQIATFTVQDGEYTKGHFSTRRFVAAGEHTLYAQFPESYVNREEWDEERFGKALFGVERRIFVDGLDVEGPYDFDPRQSAQWKRLFVCSERTPDCARRVVRALATRAFRREPTSDEVDKLARLALAPPVFEAGVQLALRAVLVSPQFLFRIERDAGPRPQPVSLSELASRLSYFLWSSMPDDELLRADLANPAVVHSQVRRMLRDPKADALVSNFAGQWLQVRNIDKVLPEPSHLRDSMVAETERTFQHVMREDSSILEFLDSDYSFLNARLARHYGIDGVKGRELRRVALPTRDRGGLVTQASVLTVSSYPTRTSPVLRGLWVLENFLGAAPPPPPAGVPRLEDQGIDLSQPLKVQLRQHRADPSCAVCHNRMDAIGFGLENFDQTGAWRQADASGELPGGRQFSGPAELKRILMEDRDAFARTFSEKLLTFALGRGLERYDRAAVRGIAKAAADDGYRFSAVVMGIVDSAPFRMRRGEVQK